MYQAFFFFPLEPKKQRSKIIIKKKTIITPDIRLERDAPELPGIVIVMTSFNMRRFHMWVEFVVGSLPCSKGFFSGYSGFPLSSKINTSNFQFDLERTDTFKRVHMNS